MGIEILQIEMLISFIILLGEIIPILIVISAYPDREGTLGIILMGISLGVMGVLAHAVYVFIELMMFSSYFQYGMIMLAIIIYIPGLTGLFAGYSALLLIGRKLIGKHEKKMAKKEK